MSKIERCANCYYKAVIKQNYGTDLICRRLPPQTYVQDGEVLSGFPDTWSNNWCGEFKHKELGESQEKVRKEIYD